MNSLSLAPLLAFLIACSSQSNKESSAPAKVKPSDSVGAPSNQDAGKADGNKKDTSKKDTSKKTDANTDEEEEEEGGGSQTGGSGCRSFKDSYDTHTTVSGPVKAPLIGSINITVEADAKVRIESAAKSGSMVIDGTVTSAKPALARSTAERGISAYSDPMNMKYVTTEEQAALDGWDGLDCLIIGIKSLKSSKFDYTFEPALPFIVPTTAKGKGFARTISGIKSTIKGHFEQENGATLGTYDGQAILSQKGNSYHVTYDFGSGAPGIFATPLAEIEYELGADGKYSKITAWIWISETDKLPVPLSR